MKKQVVVIHGGDTFKSYKDYLAFLKSHKIEINKLKTKRWKETLAIKLGKGFEVIYPRMPNPMNAKYKEWKIIFDKLLPFLKNNVILVGHSLGATFLAKYLSENKFPKKILATLLVSASYNEKDANYSLADFILPKNLKKLQKQGGSIFLYHSKDDKVVPFADFKKYEKVLPEAKAIAFKNRGHFDQSSFPELVKNIKSMK